MTQSLPTPDLSHIPGPSGPRFWHTLAILRDPHGFHDRCTARFGPVYRYSFIGKETVALRGADALQWALENPGDIFSSAEGWVALADMFPGGLMLRDGEDHRAHRRVMQQAFRKSAMDGYLTALDAGMARLLAKWPSDTPFTFYPAVKALTLRLGAAVFLGFDVDDPRIDRVNRWLTRETYGAIGIARIPGPATAYGRGLRAHKDMIAFLLDLIPERRAAGGADFFSQLCQATPEDGHSWTDLDIAQHFNFLLMSAHDTTTSALVSMAWGATENPKVQTEMQAEISRLPSDALKPDNMASFPYTDMVLKEGLRLFPPVLFVPRRLTQDADWHGVHLPRGSYVMTNISAVQRDAEAFGNPSKFDPRRFSDPNAPVHRYAWSAFGGGMHKCIGLHFAHMHGRVFWTHLLRRGRLSRVRTGRTGWIHLPTPRPKDGLQVTLHANSPG